MTGMRRISLQETLIVTTCRNSKGWMTNREISSKIPVKERTVRSHTAKLAKMRLLEMVDVFGGYRYRWHPKPDKQNAQYLQKIADAEHVFTKELTAATNKRRN